MKTEYLNKAVQAAEEAFEESLEEQGEQVENYQLDLQGYLRSKTNGNFLLAVSKPASYKIDAEVHDNTVDDIKNDYTPLESIHRVKHEADFVELGEIYEYCYTHLEDWENGDIDVTDLPHVGEDETFSEFEASVILRSIAFGTCWEKHIPADRHMKIGSDEE